MGTLALGITLAGVAGCTRPTDEAVVPEVEDGPGAPMSEAADAATEQALRDIAQATNAALREAESVPAPTNAMSGQGAAGGDDASDEGEGEGDASGSTGDDGAEGDLDGADADDGAEAPEDPDAAQVAFYEPTWANSDPEGLTAAESGRIGRPALVWFHADW